MRKDVTSKSASPSPSPCRQSPVNPSDCSSPDGNIPDCPDTDGKSMYHSCTVDGTLAAVQFDCKCQDRWGGWGGKNGTTGSQVKVAASTCFAHGNLTHTFKT